MIDVCSCTVRDWRLTPPTSFHTYYIYKWYHNLRDWMNDRVHSQREHIGLVDSERATSSVNGGNRNHVNANTSPKSALQISWKEIDQNAMVIHSRKVSKNPQIEALCHLCRTTQSENTWINVIACMHTSVGL
jgi:hypothetical protein